ncbi:MAG: Rieske (2Fe-2S) protein [Burkholderiales bacterium]|nr:Rieske (2Fe-2S) protein [Opitutaceae bacterium]
MPTPHRVCPISALPPGARKIVELAGKSIGVFNVNGVFHALRNICPHQFAPLCQGKLTGYAPPSPVGEYTWASAGGIVRCPWHGWEFEIASGRSIFNPHRVRTQALPVTVEPAAAASATDTDPSVETYPVETGEGWVVVHA